MPVNACLIKVRDCPNGDRIKTEIKVDAVVPDKEFHQRRQFDKRGLGEAGKPAAREPVQRVSTMPALSAAGVASGSALACQAHNQERPIQQPTTVRHDRFGGDGSDDVAPTNETRDRSGLHGLQAAPFLVARDRGQPWRHTPGGSLDHRHAISRQLPSGEAQADWPRNKAPTSRTGLL